MADSHQTQSEVSLNIQVAELKQQLEATQQQLKETSTNLSQKSEQATNASEETELTLLQLHQVQEELEHYFLRSRDGDQLVEAQQHQLARAQSLMGRLLPVAAQSNSMYRESIEVITPDVMSESHMSVQADALLASYQKSLHRAAALLQRAFVPKSAGSQQFPKQSAPPKRKIS